LNRTIIDKDSSIINERAENSRLSSNLAYETSQKDNLGSQINTLKREYSETVSDYTKRLREK